MHVRVLLGALSKEFVQSLVLNFKPQNRLQQGKWVRKKLSFCCVWFGSRIHQVIENFWCIFVGARIRIFGGGSREVLRAKPNPNFGVNQGKPSIPPMVQFLVA